LGNDFIGFSFILIITFITFIILRFSTKPSRQPTLALALNAKKVKNLYTQAYAPFGYGKIR